eukprot:10268508-Lingulodinium_polyedra.AAC.1
MFCAGLGPVRGWGNHDNLKKINMYACTVRAHAHATAQGRARDQHRRGDVRKVVLAPRWHPKGRRMGGAFKFF